jgi:hypothetical protein
MRLARALHHSSRSSVGSGVKVRLRLGFSQSARTQVLPPSPPFLRVSCALIPFEKCSINFFSGCNVRRLPRPRVIPASQAHSSTFQRSRKRQAPIQKVPRFPGPMTGFLRDLPSDVSHQLSPLATPTQGAHVHHDFIEQHIDIVSREQ